MSKMLLGKKTGYDSRYNPSLLYFVPREPKRKEIGYTTTPIFDGVDIWNLYEVSYLDLKGKPHVKIGQLIYSSDSENIVESKSLKLYFNSFNMTRIVDEESLINIVKNDLMKGLKTDDLEFKLFDLNDVFQIKGEHGQYKLIDYIDIENPVYNVDKNLLKIIEGTEPQHLKSNLLKSNCLVTHQPDWGTAYIDIVPDKNQIDEKSLLEYIISFRDHNEFHEQCCERIFHDLYEILKPKALCVFLKYTRRGGIDINPLRIYDPDNLLNKRELKEKLKSQTFYREPRQ